MDLRDNGASKLTTGIVMEPSVRPEFAHPGWREFIAFVEHRSNELRDEVRNYPTPIARCDEQLTKLIEQRQRALNLRDLVAVSCPPDPALVDKALRAPAIDPDDETENALRATLRAMLGAMEGTP
jgi:hypothetical protein